MANKILFTSPRARDEIVKGALEKLEKELSLVKKELPNTATMYTKLVSEEMVQTLIDAREAVEGGSLRANIENISLGDGWVKIRSLNPVEVFSSSRGETFAPESEMNAKYGHVLDYGLFGKIFNNISEPDISGQISKYFQNIEKIPSSGGQLLESSFSKSSKLNELKNKMQADVSKNKNIRKGLDIAVTKYIYILSSIFAVSQILEKMNAVLLVDTSYQPLKSSLKWDLFKYISAVIWSEINEKIILDSLDRYISGGKVGKDFGIFEISLTKSSGNPKFYDVIKAGGKNKFILYSAGYTISIPDKKAFSLDDIDIGKNLYKRNDVIFGDDMSQRKFFYAFMHQLAQRKGQVEYHAVNLFRKIDYIYPNIKKK